MCLNNYLSNNILCNYSTTKTKTAKVMTAYLKEILPKTLCSLYIYRIWYWIQKWPFNFHFWEPWNKKNLQQSLLSQRKLKNRKHSKFSEKDNSQIHAQQYTLRDDTLPLAIDCFNVAPSVNDLQSPFYLAHGRDLLEGRLNHLQCYCRYVGEQPGRLAVQELRNIWMMHAKLLQELRQSGPETDKKYNSTRNLKEGKLVLMKNHNVTAFQPKYLADYRVIKVINKGKLVLMKNHNVTAFQPNYLADTESLKS